METWCNAFRSLQDALGQAATGDNIRVAQGTYKPTALPDHCTSSDRCKTFLINVDELVIRGGYRGYAGCSGDPCECGESADDWDPSQFETILSGDIGTTSASDNCFHVVTVDGVTNLTVLRGVTIEDGNTDGDPNSQNCATPVHTTIPASGSGGAGLVCRDADPQIRDCRFVSNRGNTGGAMLLLCSDPRIINCTFEENVAVGAADMMPDCGSVPAHTPDVGRGGAIAILHDSAPRIHNCEFRCNLAGHIGGAVATRFGALPDFTNCVFVGNATNRFGGGIRVGHDSGVVMVNCTFAGNTACSGGGYSLTPDPADQENPPEPARDSQLSNCILWGNTTSDTSVCDPIANGLGKQISIDGDYGDQSLTIHFCDVEGGEDGIYTVNPERLDYAVDNKDDDPSFADPPNDVRLADSSVCIDGGDPSYVFADGDDIDQDNDPTEKSPRDAGGGNRFLRAEVDMGAYESDFCSADLDLDGDVDATDMGILLGDWSETCNSPCPEDLHADNLIGSADLSILFGQWGDCESAMRSTGGGLTPQQLVEQLQFESIDELVAWLSTLDVQTMIAWLETMLGGS